MLRKLMTGVAIAAIMSGCAWIQDRTQPKDRAPTTGALTTNMAAQGGSGQSGTATLTPDGNNTRVALNIKPGASGVAQPAHIHEGTCAKLNPAPKYGLAPVTDGKSSTSVAVPLSTLLASPHAINVHKSQDDAKTYVSCADIKR